MKKMLSVMLVLLLLLGGAAAESCRHYFETSDIPLRSGWWYREWDAGVEYRVYHKRICINCGMEDVTYRVIPDEDVPRGGVQVCPHVARDFEVLRAGDEAWALQVAGKTEGFSSAACTLCNEDWLFYQGDPAGLSCDGRNHIFIRQPEVVEEGWATGSAGWEGSAQKPEMLTSYTHVYTKYYRAVCVGCDAELKCYAHDRNPDGTLVMGEEHSLVEVASYHRMNSTMHVSVVQCSVCGYTTARETACNVYNSGWGMCEEEMKKAWEFYGLE